MRQWFGCHTVGGLGDQPLIGAVRGLPPTQMTHAACGGKLQRRVAEFGIVEHHHRLAIADDEAKLWRRQPPVHRCKYRADAGAGELEFEQVG